MLKVQEYLLSGKSFEDLHNEFAIELKFHNELEIVTLNYNQIDSPRKHFIADECRGLVLQSSHPYKLISRSFARFYNIGEFNGEEKNFNWNDFKTFEKLDGCFPRSASLNLWDGGVIAIGKVVKYKLNPKLIGMDKDGNIVPCYITNHFRNGVKNNFVRIKSENNRGYRRDHISMKVTTNHHILINGEFKAVSELKIGDKLTTFSNSPHKSVIHFIESSLLGDGSLTKNGNKYRYQEGHKIEHQEYVDYLDHCLGECKTKQRPRISGFGSQMIDASSKSYKILNDLRYKWYPEGKRKIPQDITWIDEFTIAKLYMDNGCLSHTESQEDRAVFSMNCFEEIDVTRLANHIEFMFNVKCTVFNSKGWNIRINAGKNNGINAFWEKISKYIVPCMRYKLPLRFRKEDFIKYEYGKENKISYENKVLSIEPLENTIKNFPDGRIGYDIETTTNNYFINNTLVHNSMVQLYNYNEKWVVKTRGSWADGVCDQLSGKTWSDLIWEVLDINKVEKFCDKSCTYVLEFVSPWNQVVVWYSEPKLYLLTIFEGEKEVRQEESDKVANQLQIGRPRVFELNTLDQLTEFLQTMFVEGKLDEGFVILDSEGVRWKMKNPGYLAASKLHNNGQIANIKSIVPIVLMGESSEVLATLKHSGGAIYDKVKEKFDEVKITLDTEYENLVKLWEEAKLISDQKTFALSVVPRTKFSSILFRVRKGEGSLRDIWMQSSDLILKVLYGK